jgi:hypothetical protein
MMAISVSKSARTDSNKFAAIRAKATAKQANTTEQPKKRSGHAKVREPRFGLDTPGYYSTGEVLWLTGWAAAKLFNKIKDASFPVPRKDGNRNVWRTSVLKDALGL